MGLCMEIERKKLPKEALDQQKRICEVSCEASTAEAPSPTLNYKVLGLEVSWLW